MFSRLRALFALGLVLAACSHPKPAAPPVAPADTKTVLAVEPAPALVAAEATAALPIYAEDARWGSPSAPVTLIDVTDLQCPFCARAESTVRALREHYGPQMLRIVVKHNPLPFHNLARPAALAAIGVQRAAGDDAFFRFVAKVYANQQELSELKFAEWAREAAATGAAHPSPLGLEEQLERDKKWAEGAGAYGTPAFFVNGNLVSGAQPYENFTAAIDAELAAVVEARNAGKPSDYPARVAANFVKPEARKTASIPEEDDKIWAVPIAGAPVQGPDDALVTIVEFSDYECPFCKKVQATLAALREKYGADLRIVLRQNPLPFHSHARPASTLALEAFAEKGNAGFWAVSQALFAATPGEMETDGLLEIARKEGLDARKVDKALQKNAHDASIATDQELAEDFSARGTPHFFVNGRRLSGARPIEEFVKIIDERLEVARALVAKGVPRSKVFALILEHGEGPARPPVVDASVLTKTGPSRGPGNARVLVHEFSDYQCPFCKRVEPTLTVLASEYPKDVRIVWHDLPLEFHPRARAAANATREVRARGGDAAFWKMHALVFENQKDLSDDQLGALAERVGVPKAAVLSAIQSGRHDAAIDEDVALAGRLGIRGTPGFVVNGYVISGAQPLTAFRRTVKLSLEDVKRGVTPAVTVKDDTDND